MTECALVFKHLKAWFTDYVRGFYSGDKASDTNFQLKEQHTYRVCNEIKKLGTNLKLDQKLLCLSEITALFHDIGRFEQYRKYKTFVDKKSENHAQLSLITIESLNLLKDLSVKDREKILTAIKCHNMAKLPENLGGNTLLLSKMIRDADKLDIWRIVTDYYSSRTKNQSIELDLPDKPEISEKVFQSAISGQTVLSSDMKTLNDFKIMQIGWVYDLNFSYSVDQCLARSYLDKIKNSISAPEKAALVYLKTREYIDSCLNKPTSRKEKNDKTL